MVSNNFLFRSLSIFSAVVTVSLGISVPAYASTTAKHYYVDSVKGSDSNNGTSISKPLKSLNKVDQLELNAGDVVSLKKDSVFTDDHLDIWKAGTSSNIITFNSYGSGSDPVITTSPANNVNTCVTIESDYVYFSQINVKNCGTGIQVSGSHDWIVSNIVSGNASGIAVNSPSTDVLISRNKIQDNNRMWVDTVGGDDDSGAFSIVLNSTNTTVSDNIISGAYSHSYDYGLDGSAIEVYNSSNNNILRNYITNCEAGIEMGGKNSNNNLVAYNIIDDRSMPANSGNFGIVTHGNDDFGPVLNTKIINNTIFTNLDSGGALAVGDSTIIQNNLSNSKDAYWASNRGDHNIAYYINDNSNFASSTNVRLSSPLTNPYEVPSIAKNAGVANGLIKDINGNPVDPNHPSIGAMEK